MWGGDDKIQKEGRTQSHFGPAPPILFSGYQYDLPKIGVFSKYVLSAYSRPGTPLDTVDAAIHKTNEAPSLMKFMF